MAEWTATLFPNGRPLVYTSSLNGKTFATQWTSLAGATAEGLIELESFLEIDMTALGQGGSPFRQRTRLLCTEEFAPVHYESQSGAKKWSLDFEADQIIVHPPGAESEQRLPRAGTQYLFGTTGQQAIALAILHDRGLLGTTTLTVFLPDPLLTVPYALTPAPDLGSEQWLRSSHEEELLVDHEGRLRVCRVPKKGIVNEIAAPPLALPDWARDDSIARPRVRYTPPTNARFRLLDVTIDGPVTPIGATLSIPDGSGPFPAVLFLGGSGVHDRHGIAGEIDMGTHEIVDHLVERGLAGLRYDSRGGGTTRFGPDALDLGLSALVDDASACLEFLVGRSEVDRERIFLIGHSEGGTLALALIARRGVAPKGLVLMAPIGRDIDEVMFDQLESQGRTIGLSEAQIASQRDDLRAFVELARSDRPWESGSLPDHLLGLVRSRTWLREHLQNPTTALIAQVRCPVLICQGEKDFQISVERDAKRLVAAARAAGVEVELATFPDLDHLFKPAKGEGSMADFYDPSRRVSPDFLTHLDDWLTEHL